MSEDSVWWIDNMKYWVEGVAVLVLCLAGILGGAAHLMVEMVMIIIRRRGRSTHLLDPTTRVIVARIQVAVPVAAVPVRQRRDCLEKEGFMMMIEL